MYGRLTSDGYQKSKARSVTPLSAMSALAFSTS
jgi:hypothetical protein